MQGYKNSPDVKPRIGDLVLWQGAPTVVRALGEPSDTLINCSFDGELCINRPELIELLVAAGEQCPVPVGDGVTDDTLAIKIYRSTRSMADRQGTRD